MKVAEEQNLESAPCPLCGSSAVTDGRAYAFPGQPYRAVRCADCRLWYLNPRLREAEMLKLYADDSYFGRDDDQGYSGYADQSVSLKLTFRRLLKQLHKGGHTGGRLLEIGCGYGYLLEEAAPYFSHRTGTDFSADAVAQASRRCERAILGGVDDLPDGEMYDLIVAVGVIEHIYTPLAFTEKLSRRLPAGGKLVLATPDMGSFWRLFMGSRWTSFKLPEHVTYYDDASLRQLFARSGFHNMKALGFPHAFPLSLIFEKLGMRLGGPLGRLNAWLPATTVAMSGEK